MLGAIDKRNVDVFQVFARRVVNDWRGIGPARRASEASKRTAAMEVRSMAARPGAAVCCVAPSVALIDFSRMFGSMFPC